jgi:dienelactone hydrolase
MLPILLSIVAMTTLGVAQEPAAAEPWPDLPGQDQRVELPAQEWPLRPGPRTIEVLVHYPGGKLTDVTPGTGIMLSLHNWGGTDCAGTASPTALAGRLDVVTLCVNYLQSGPKDSIEGPEPYDFGYLQALDALRALHWMYAGLKTCQIDFASDRLFATGGSGGGNVTLMACKLAPRTFTAIVDMCGMKKLSDDIAFNIPGGSGLNARYRRESEHPFVLTRDHQELRWLGNPDHLKVMADLRSPTKIVTVHGADDRTCPFADAEEFVANTKAARLDIHPHFVRKDGLDGKVFTSSAHALGNRTEIVFQVAGQWLDPSKQTSLRRPGATDFERKEDVRYPTSNGVFVISYKDGFPVGRFEPTAPPPVYSDHADLQHFIDSHQQRQPIRSVDDWLIRKQHVQRHLQAVMGQLPGPLQRVPLAVKTLEEVQVDGVTRRKLTYQSDAADRVPAYLFIPDLDSGAKLPAVLCLQQTTAAGKAEPAGLAGDPSLHYALHLAKRGYVTFAPDYPSFGEHTYKFGLQTGYTSGSMKAVWDNIRAVDLLQSLSMVDGERLGCIGHSLGGHNTMFTAVFEPRLKVLVSNCGFSSFRKDDIPSWTGPRYMPRIASVYGNDPAKVPFDFPELIACFAPRPFLASAAEGDRDFDVSGVRDCIRSARTVYDLFNASAALEESYYPGPHAFPDNARDRAYAFLDRHLAK